MIWIFALGIITLAVFHLGFRQIVFWVAGLGAGVFCLLALIGFLSH